MEPAFQQGLPTSLAIPQTCQAHPVSGPSHALSQAPAPGLPHGWFSLICHLLKRPHPVLIKSQHTPSPAAVGSGWLLPWALPWALGAATPRFHLPGCGRWQMADVGPQRFPYLAWWDSDRPWHQNLYRTMGSSSTQPVVPSSLAHRSLGVTPKKLPATSLPSPSLFQTTFLQIL